MRHGSHRVGDEGMHRRRLTCILIAAAILGVAALVALRRHGREVTRSAPAETAARASVEERPAHEDSHTSRLVLLTATVSAERTAKFHVTSIFQKLGADNRAQAVALAGQRGLL